MNSNVEMVDDVATYVDFNELFFTPRFAADCFGLTTRRLKDIEEANNIEIRRVPRGTVTSRVYTPSTFSIWQRFVVNLATSRAWRVRWSCLHTFRKAALIKPPLQSVRR